MVDLSIRNIIMMYTGGGGGGGGGGPLQHLATAENKNDELLFTAIRLWVNVGQ